MTTAIINARSSSERLSKKHLMKIGNKSIFEHIIDNLLKIKQINEIYVATGSYEKNCIYEKFLKKKYPNRIKFFYFQNENDVTARIYYLSKKINNKYTISISGDCPLIDVQFIRRLISRLKNNPNYEFIYSKKEIIHEGIKLFKTSAWSKVFEKSNLKIYKENPGYIVKKKPSMFKILEYTPLKYETLKKYRISVDTQSDLDFLNYVFFLLKKKKLQFSLKNLLKLKNLIILNKHVHQRKPDENKKKIIILTSKNSKIGLGHYKRSLVIKREISERTNSFLKIINLNNENLKKKKIINLKKDFRNNDLLIIDLPKNYLVKLKNHLSLNKNILIIDNIINNKNFINLIPNLCLIKKQKNTYTGLKYLLLSREIDLINLTFNKKEREIQKLLIIGGTLSIDGEILDFMIKNKKNLTIIMGPFVKQNIINNLKKNNFSVIVNPLNIFEYIKRSKKIYCKFGISTFEILALKKKPIVFSKFNEFDGEIIKELNKRRLINIYGKRENNSLQKIEVNNCLNNFTEILTSKFDVF